MNWPMEIIDCDPVIEECEALWCDGGTIGDQWCNRCGGSGFQTFDRSALFTLAHNLSVAGSLCLAFNLGWFGRSCDATPGSFGPDLYWWPGCGRTWPPEPR